MLAQSEIHLGRTSRDHRIVVDGHDITKAVSSVEIRAGVSGPPTAVISLPIVQVTRVDGAQVRLTPGMRDALVTLGWTPPPDA